MKPIDYKQYDARWGNSKYATKGENSTIKSSGCGTTCSAMVIASLKDKSVTPKTTSEWSMANGYKALNQGTYYTYFKPQFKKYGIECRQLNNSACYHNLKADVHKIVEKELNKGNWVIGVMGKGLWTSSGHFVLAYKLENGKVYINDPASINPTRLKNRLSTWQNEVKYYWVIDKDKPKKDNSNSVTVSTQGSTLSCRKIANKNGSIVGNFSNGTELILIKKSYRKWWKVKGKDISGNMIEGFCSTEFLS